MTDYELSTNRCISSLFFSGLSILIQNVKERWVPEITYHCPKTPFMLTGTQIDLREDPFTTEKLARNKQNPITPEAAEKLAGDLKAVKYVERSALTQKGLKNVFRASLVAQWLRICLPMHGTRVRALVWEDPTCHGATRPMSHSY